MVRAALKLEAASVSRAGTVLDGSLTRGVDLR